jgi:RNA polymerase sigma-70 factor (ECF subfamily)
MNFSDLDHAAFNTLVAQHRRELQSHCYRMMGSVQDAQDMVQETFLRAWRARDTYEGRATVRAWLYKIATNACLDVLKKHPKRYVPFTRESASTLDQPIPASVMDPIWLEPYPDSMFDSVIDDPEAQVSERQTIKLAFVAALHLLPPRQRAVLLLADVLEWQASEIASTLDTTVAAVKSLLHCARATLAKQPTVTMLEGQRLLDAEQQALLERYMRAWETADVESFTALIKEDAIFSMPPIPSWYQGRETLRGLVAMTIFSGQAQGRWRMLPTGANGQPAFGLYRAAGEAGVWNAYGIQVVDVEDGLLANMITFRVPALFACFGLPITISDR